MTPQTYLVMIRDGRLALAVADALEERLSADGYRAMALVLASGRLEQADQCSPVPWPAGSGPRPQVVALYEEGLLSRLKALGLAAYIGVPQDQDWQVIRWDEQAGAIMLPVGNARDLVDGVAEHTPWSTYAVRDWRAASAARPPRRPAARSLKIALASTAGPLLLAGLPAAAAGAAVPPTTPGGPASTAPGSTVLAGFPVYVPPTEPPQEIIPFDDDPSGYPPNPDYVPPGNGPRPAPGTVTPDGPLPSEPSDSLPVEPIPNAAPPGSPSNKPDPIPPNWPYQQPPGPDEQEASAAASDPSQGTAPGNAFALASLTRSGDSNMSMNDSDPDALNATPDQSQAQQDPDAQPDEGSQPVPPESGSTATANDQTTTPNDPTAADPTEPQDAPTDPVQSTPTDPAQPGSASAAGSTTQPGTDSTGDGTAQPSTDSTGDGTTSLAGITNGANGGGTTNASFGATTNTPAGGGNSSFGGTTNTAVGGGNSSFGGTTNTAVGGGNSSFGGTTNTAVGGGNSSFGGTTTITASSGGNTTGGGSSGGGASS
jgi:hypothetical protein